ncbi:MAG: hypothetical protein AAGI90_00090 [Chlamydiota bacterium]
MAKKHLTNEQLKKIFKGNYLLTNYAIHIARDTVMAGKYSNLDSLLAEIQKQAQSVTEQSEKDQVGIA